MRSALGSTNIIDMNNAENTAPNFLDMLMELAHEAAARPGHFEALLQADNAAHEARKAARRAAAERRAEALRIAKSQREQGAGMTLTERVLRANGHTAAEIDYAIARIF